ncbi:MAG: translesion DNA synthesis-associated protein ImuA [Gammaproteobacteria bacterium]
MTSISTPHASAVQQLLQDSPALWRGREHGQFETVSTGFDVLDSTLPGGGWPIGTLIELAPACSGIGELSLPLPALQRLASENKPIALVRPPYIPYAPALRRAGLPLKKILWIAESNDADARWAAEQLLRDGAGAVLLWSDAKDDRSMRRLQLAAEAGRALAFVYRPTALFNQSSPAALRVALQPAGHELRVEVVKVRRGQPAVVTLTLPWPLAAS